MKIAHLSTVLLMVLSNSVFAQSYKLSVENKTFENLTDSISINEGLTWDDPDQSVPIGFTWSFFDKQIDTLFMIGEGFLSSETLDIASVIYPVGADLIDRGQKSVSDDFHTNSLSPI